MLISAQPAFLFIHIDKAAGTSIQRALQSFATRRADNRLRRRLVWLGSFNRLGGLHRAVEFPEHVDANTVKTCLPADLYARMFKFAFVRNPWDRLVSRHAYLLRSEDHRRHAFVKQMESFENYVDWEISRGMHQHAYVTDRSGALIVDFIGYFERVDEDFAKVCAKLGVTAKLPQANKSSHRDYRSCYTPELRDKVAKHFRRDIELFKYTFDGLAANA